MVEPELTDRDAELRRQQLKEVLAKQAELGCEVAEIPSHYLLDSEKQVHGQEENKRAFNKKGRSRNKFNKRGRPENDRLAKKQRPSDTDAAILNDQTNVFNQTQRMRNNDPSTGPITKKREPTLLQKLLSADLRRDRGRLLQVFRFMVMNSFFKDRPEKPLIFPLVTVKQNEGEGELVEEKSSFRAGVHFEGKKTITGNCNDSSDNEDDFTEAQVNETGNVAKEESSIGKAIKGVEEEEGEIID